MVNNDDNQHNPSSYAEVILFNADKTERETEGQVKPAARLVPGMFSSISDAELFMQKLAAESDYHDETVQ